MLKWEQCNVLYADYSEGLSGNFMQVYRDVSNATHNHFHFKKSVLLFHDFCLGIWNEEILCRLWTPAH